LETITTTLHLARSALRHDAPIWRGHLTAGKTALLLQPAKSYSRRTAWGKKMLARPASLLPLLWWAHGLLSVPCRLGSPHTSFKLTQAAGACIHMSHGSRLYIPTREGSDVATHPVAPDPTSQLLRALVLPRIPWLSIGHE
jgi:hypothetical protein